MRIVSLLPSATEIVCLLGAQAELVGRSHECNYPGGLDHVPVLTRPRAALPSASGAIDQAVRTTVEQALAIYEIDVDGLVALQPDLVITQDLCQVCAISEADVRSALSEVAGNAVTLLSLRPTRLGEIWDDVRLVGARLGRDGTGAAAKLEHRVETIAQRARGVSTRPRVLSIEWLDPVMVGGMWMPELIEAAGGAAMVVEPGQHAPTLRPAVLRQLDPEVLLIKPCGFDLLTTEADLAAATRNLPMDLWRSRGLTAAFVADGDAYFNRSGPRMIDSLEILAACVHPLEFADFAQRHSAGYRLWTAEGRLL